MPSIDGLDAALAVADSDLFPVSQNHVARKASRAQILNGVQRSIVLGSGQLLGRNSPGTGAPEPVAVGSNLVLQGGTLSAQISPLNVAGLAVGAAPAASDLVPFAQGGRNVAVSYAAFMGGIGALGTVDASAMTVRPSGGTVARTLADVLGDAVTVEAFGAHGDGTSDDTAAFAAAVASGRPIRLAGKTYVINGQFTIVQAGVTLIGVAGLTVLKRMAQTGNGAWIAVQADGFRAEDIIFDANGTAVATESWGVLVGSQCLRSDFHRCTFRNAFGATLGSGLVLQSSDPAVSEHVVRDCTFSGNAAHGLWVQACDGVLVEGCRAFGNVRYGIAADFNDSSFAKKLRLAQILGNRCWGNQRGISVGNYNATNLQPPTWGNANPDAIGILVAGNVCHDNAIYGIAISGQAILVQGNLLSNNGVGVTGGAGILANSAQCALRGNTITGSATYGIDSGGSIGLDVTGNAISGPAYGLNCGGSQSVLVSGNRMQGCTVFAVGVNNVEADGNGVNFGLATSGLVIRDNWIGVDGTAGGIWLRDGPSQVQVAGNQFVGSGAVGNCLWADTDSVSVSGNRFNFIGRHACNPAPAGGLQQVVYPDIADAIVVSSAPSGVQSMVSGRQAQLAGKIGFVRIAAGGSGYSQASIAIGGGGSGAAANAVISNGVVIGAVVTTAGGGYGAIGATVAVTVSGDGSGATGVAYVATPLPDERRLAVRCDAAVTFASAGAVPAQQNWTGADIAMQPGGEVAWVASGGAWRAASLPAGLLLGGTVRHVAAGEAVGCTSGVGRGAPEGVVTAMPGSDWRNLDGGTGSTYWIKRTGTGPTGWVAVA